MKKMLSILTALSRNAVCIALMCAITQCGPSSERAPFPAEAWSDGDSSVGQPVSSVRATIQGDVVTITYDLTTKADVWVVPSFDNGMSYCGALQAVKGDVGKDVTSGTGKSIVWNFRAEQDSITYCQPFDISSVRLKIVADTPVLHDTTPYVFRNDTIQLLISPEGTVIAGPDRYSTINDETFSGHVDNFMPVPVENKTGKWGMIDHNGKEVLPCRYHELSRINPFLYYAVEDEESDVVQILSNTGKLLGEALPQDAGMLGCPDGIKTCMADTTAYVLVRGRRQPIVKGVYIGKCGATYIGRRCIDEFTANAYYPYTYNVFPHEKMVVPSYLKRETLYKSLDEEAEYLGHKISFREYMKDDSQEGYDYYYRKGHTAYSFMLPKGISPFKSNGSAYTERLTGANIVKAIDDKTHRIGVYSIWGNEIIPCEWTGVYVFADEDRADNSFEVNFYLCLDDNSNGRIIVPSQEIGEHIELKTIAFTKGLYITRFANAATHRALEPEFNQWKLYDDPITGGMITFVDNDTGKIAMIDREGHLVSDDIIDILWADSGTYSHLVGLNIVTGDGTQYFDTDRHKFVDCLQGAEPCGYIPPMKYCMRLDGKTVVYDAAQGKITHSAEDKVPINDYADNRILLSDKDGRIYLADSTLNVVYEIHEKLHKAKRYSEGLCWVQEFNEKWHLLDDSGKAVAPGVWTWDVSGNINEYNDGLCRIKKNGRYGYADRNGRIVIPCIYADAKDFSCGRSIVSDDGCHWGVIDRKGAMIYPCVFTSEALARSRAM